MTYLVDHWDSLSDSYPADIREDSYMWYEEMISRFDTAEVDDAWAFACCSDQGGEVYVNLQRRRVPYGVFKLKFNLTDAMLLKKARVVIAQSLKKS